VYLETRQKLPFQPDIRVKHIYMKPAIRKISYKNMVFRIFEAISSMQKKSKNAAEKVYSCHDQVLRKTKWFSAPEYRLNQSSVFHFEPLKIH
jgi:hypothetical protein